MCNHTFIYHSVVPPTHCPVCGACLMAPPAPPLMPPSLPYWPRPYWPRPWYPWGRYPHTIITNTTT